ncbi:MAG: DUF4157 domain-containing protein [Gammaproteobacteria bacterium]
MTRAALARAPGATLEPGAATLLQRKCACGRPATTLAGECADCQREETIGLQAKLAVGASGDPYEIEADRIADDVMRMADTAVPSPMPAGGMATAARLQSKPPVGRGRATHDNDEGAPFAVHEVLRSSGQPLDPAVRTFFEPRFGHDFSRVRVHLGSRADESARAVQARAYTVGRDLAFARGQYNPASVEGKRLLAHELTHVLQQAGANRLRDDSGKCDPRDAQGHPRRHHDIVHRPQKRRSPALQRVPEDAPAPDAATADPLCAKFDLDATRKDVEAQAKHFTDTADLLPLVRSLKRIRRCATPDQQTQIVADLSKTIPADKATEAWNSAATAFGGYVGFYPGFAPDIKTHLGKLGTSESLAAGTFELSAEGAKHRSRAKATAAGEVGDLGRTDIVYFRGHQYAQYRAPGLFANGDESRGFDLRYVEKVGGFANVKLMISTSCATLCKEAIEVFTSLFPNAVILGYRKSAPIDGAAVRNDLTKRINDLNRPLLIDEPVDVAAIISIWKSVIESRHKGQTGPLPGFYQGGTVEYWDGSAWQNIAATDATNGCRRKGDFRGQYPAPP